MSFPFLYHGQTTPWVTLERRKLTLTLATDKTTPFHQVLIRHEPDNEEYFAAMSVIQETEHLRYWQGEFELRHDQPLNSYTFKLILEKQQYWLSAWGVTNRMPGLEKHFKINPDQRPPSWVKHQVFYQIFPDRFCNGKPEISTQDNEYQVADERKTIVAKQWEEPVDNQSGNGGYEFYGGDLYGVEHKLDYLQELGITTLYLNPIFASPSNHRYDTMDYYNVDPHLGNNEHFAALCGDTHQRGMKIVLDAVFNHTSTEHPWFNRLGWHQDPGAYQSSQSRYRDYYFFAGDSQQYIGWKGVKSLPVLNFENAKVRDAIYQSEDSIIKYWLKPPYNIDGWRFDVIHMLGEGEGAKNNAHYVKAFRDSAKAVNPDSYVLGEHFFEASSWLQGDQEDGSMNYYGFAHPLRALLANKDIALDPISITMFEFRDWLAEARAKIPWDNQLAQLNQLDSHDTPRFFTLLDQNQALFKIAVTFLFTYVGTPCLYYGTEIGMQGGADPDNRRCMEWDKLHQSELLPFFKQQIELRKTRPALRYGSYIELYCDEACLVFARTCSEDTVLVGINLSQVEKDVSLSAEQTELLNLSTSKLLIGPMQSLVV
ncbi:maltodextrin glucosidase [Vibrio sinaloensis]|uniref:maltodextrin glucosidase n=1 Tax=Photobacterium sp. (strain ATCC 43367) TaxID=379097 RepID=UPI0020630D84|nr:maltodextrin glucosidase [Vibrio sinaloensis]UPQ89580.1 maltodextrin glucosidase [Vibrio sinaloensis]